MGGVQPYGLERLVMGVLIADRLLYGSLCTELEELFGPILDQTEPIPFGYTDYYDLEMGGKPYRFYLSFSKLIDPSQLYRCKMQTNALENRYCKEGKRRVNLDPGLLSLSNLVLATTKGRAHRIALQQGIWAEVTLIYSKGSFQSLPWTYADYRQKQVVQLFLAWRKKYHEQLKQEGLALL